MLTCSARIPRVHGDEHVAVTVQLHVRSLELEHFLVLPLAFVDDEDLLGDNGQHFDVDAVELVEATPRPAPGKTLCAEVAKSTTAGAR